MILIPCDVPYVLLVISELTVTGYVDFEDDTDLGFGTHEKDILKPQKLSFEVDFKVYSPVDIQAQQDKQIEEVSTILGQSLESAAILLRHFRWNKEHLIESYMDKPEEVLEKAGLSESMAAEVQTKVVSGFTCEICFEDDASLQTYAMRCGHRYCVDCFGHYLTQKIKEEGEAARIECPKEGCHRILDSKSLELLVVAALQERYEQFDARR